MATHPVAGPVNFNLAVESLKQTLRLEKSVTAALSHAKQASVQAGHWQDEGGVIQDPNRGTKVSTRV